MSGITCAHHPDRPALGYCAGCGRPLCGRCVVRLPVGNYCGECASAPGHRPRAPARPGRVWLWAGAAALATALYVLSRLL
jgi:hypothetical protein